MLRRCLLYRKVRYKSMKNNWVYRGLVVGLLFGIFMALLSIREQVIIMGDEISASNVDLTDDGYVDGFEEMKRELHSKER